MFKSVNEIAVDCSLIIGLLGCYHHAYSQLLTVSVQFKMYEKFKLAAECLPILS